jgi:hypothetical protein
VPTHVILPRVVQRSDIHPWSQGTVVNKGAEEVYLLHVARSTWTLLDV